MKYIRIITALFIGLIFMVSCEDTNENLVQERGANVMPLISNLSPAAFTTDVQNSYIAFTVSLPEGQAVDKASIEVATDSSSAVLKAISSFPETVNVTAIETAEALGLTVDEVIPGSVFYVSVLTEKDGRISRSKTATLTVNVFCAFDEALTVGSYYEFSAAWEVEGDVTLTADASDPYKIYIDGMPVVEGLSNGTGNLVELNIDPETYAISGGSTVFAPDLSDWGMGDYTNYTFELVSGYYSPCDGTYDIVFDISVDQGGWGENSFTFTRK